MKTLANRCGFRLQARSRQIAHYHSLQIVEQMASGGGRVSSKRASRSAAAATNPRSLKDTVVGRPWSERAAGVLRERGRTLWPTPPICWLWSMQAVIEATEMPGEAAAVAAAATAMEAAVSLAT